MTDYGVDGFIKMDLPNSWECPRCIKLREDAKDELKDEPDGGMLPPKVPKVEEPDPLRRKLASGSDAVIAGTYQLFSVKGTSDQVSQKTTIGFFSHCTALSTLNTLDLANTLKEVASFTSSLLYYIPSILEYTYKFDSFT